MKNTMISLTVVLGLLVVSANAAPIIAKRDDDAASCPATLRGPSGNAYFTFSTNLSIQTARKACASCYGGSLANVSAGDLNFLGNNLESTSWIKAWNGDDYSSGCLTIQPSAGAQPGVGIDANCASRMWPLCTASAEQVEGLQRIDEEQQHTGEETIITLAVPYKQTDAAPAPGTIAVNDVALEPTKVDAEESPAAPDATRPEGPKVTCPKKPDGTSQTDDACIEAAEETAAVVVIVEEPTKVVDETKAKELVPDSTTPAVPRVTCPGPEAIAAEIVVEQPAKVEDEANAVVPDATHPIEPTVTCPRKLSGGYESESNCIQSEEVAAAVVLEELAKVAAEDNAVVSDATSPVSPEVTCPRSVNGQVQTDNNCIVPEEAAAVVQEEPIAPVEPAVEPVAPAVEPVVELVAPAAEPVAPAAEPVAPAAEPVAPAAAEAPAPAAAEVPAATPAAVVETIEALTTKKEKVQAAFEADTGSCSTQLALGEQDPLINEYMIETLSETASCSEARQEAIAADVQARVARYEAAQTALQALPSSA